MKIRRVLRMALCFKNGVRKTAECAERGRAAGVQAALRRARAQSALLRVQHR